MNYQVTFRMQQSIAGASNHLLHRSRVILSALIMVALVSCGPSKDPGVPDNALSPDLMENPASASKGAQKDLVPVIEFRELKHDFGSITQGEKVSYSFPFKNTGKGDLIVRSANASCGCTVPEWPKDPVKPGGEGVIVVTFNSEGKSGMQDKKVTIIMNTIPNSVQLTITGEVTIPR